MEVLLKIFSASLMTSFYSSLGIYHKIVQLMGQYGMPFVTKFTSYFPGK